jgi:hypothetical protein
MQSNLVKKLLITSNGMKFKNLPKLHPAELIVIFLGIFFGVFLMFSTFSEKGDTLFIAGKAWSDFASHIPLIRSFSLGDNMPPQYPLFPGEPIKYHFLFYFLVGTLEKIGFPISWALNIPSALGFALLVFVIYYFAKELFKSRAVGLISVIFFLFNSSLSFIYFFKNNPLSENSIKQIINLSSFQSFAPYGDGIITAFWNLNIFTNQRHFALSLALSMILIILIIRPIIGRKKFSNLHFLILGILFGLSFFLHTAVFLMTAIVLGILLILFKELRNSILIVLASGAFIALPQYLYLSGSEGFSPKFVLGYLISHQLNVKTFIEFWVYNLGLSSILIILGLILSNRNQQKIFLAFFFLFIVGNIMQFSPEIAANHKFFNYFIIFGNMFTAFFLVFLWKKVSIIKIFLPVIFIFMILGGVIDFFPIYNDSKLQLEDYKKNMNSSWIESSTPKDAIFLNTILLYNPASLAGRKIYLGWPYFAWSQGYDTDKRAHTLRQILGSENKNEACNLLLEEKIDFIEIKEFNPPDPNVPPVSSLYEKEFIKTYSNPNTNYTIYNVHTNCPDE